MELGRCFKTARYNSSQLLSTFGKTKVRRDLLAQARDERLQEPRSGHYEIGIYACVVVPRGF